LCFKIDTDTTLTHVVTFNYSIFSNCYCCNASGPLSVFVFNVVAENVIQLFNAVVDNVFEMMK